jgi:hypothetical protein
VDLLWVQVPPGNWVAPAGSYRSGGGGNETVGAFETNASLGDAASKQAVTRVNVEQASKRQMWAPTRQDDGEGCHRWGQGIGWNSPPHERSSSSGLTGVMTTACLHRRFHETRETPAVRARDPQPDAREGQAGLLGATERPVVPMKPGNSGRGKGPWFKANARSGRQPGDWREPNTST